MVRENLTVKLISIDFEWKILNGTQGRQRFRNDTVVRHESRTRYAWLRNDRIDICRTHSGLNQHRVANTDIFEFGNFDTFNALRALSLVVRGTEEKIVLFIYLVFTLLWSKRPLRLYFIRL